MKKVGIIDYGMGNLDSVRRAVEECGGYPIVTDQRQDIEQANFIILPGVGSFHEGMRNLRQCGLDEVLTEQVVEKGIPFLGICLGMQLLATKGWEVEETIGLGWIHGEVRRLEPSNQTERIPHVGWNEVDPTRESPLFAGVPTGKDFYFVHSYHLCCLNERDVLARTPYCGSFVSAAGRDHLLGVQFHPEKSQRPGFQVIKNFLTL